MIRNYVHKNLGETITAIGGHYTLTHEAKISYKGRTVFYLLGYGVVDTSCCGSGGCGYALVKGYVIEWKTKKDLAGNDITCVEPVRESDEQEELRKLIATKESIQQVNFLY